jgi:hypothetical protein
MSWWRFVRLRQPVEIGPHPRLRRAIVLAPYKAASPLRDVVTLCVTSNRTPEFAQARNRRILVCRRGLSEISGSDRSE